MNAIPIPKRIEALASSAEAASFSNERSQTRGMSASEAVATQNVSAVQKVKVSLIFGPCAETMIFNGRIFIFY